MAQNYEKVCNFAARKSKKSIQDMKNALRMALLSFIFALPFASMAETAQQLVVTLTDKSEQTFWLSEEPHVTFGTTDLTVALTTGVTYTVERNQVSTFTFKTVETDGIHTPGCITTTAGVNRLFDLNGKLLQEKEININGLPAGTYILQSPGKKTVKILVQ